MSIILSFDIEEFDLPRLHNIRISDKEMFEISYKGTKKLINLLNEYKVKATFFVTLSFAKKYPKLTKEIAKVHEIGFHGVKHDHLYGEMNEKEALKYLKNGKKELEKIIGKKVYGFRAPRLSKPSFRIIKKAGFGYDSSVNPVFLPGFYNNFFDKRKPYEEDRVKEFPLGSYPLIRLPLMWITFRNLPLVYTRLGIWLNKETVLYFHPWEFVDLNRFKIPFLIKRNTGETNLKKLVRLIKWGRKYSFVRIIDLIYK